MSLTALHIDHGLHAASAAWADHCRNLCARHGIECVLERVRVAKQGNLEGNARQARYGVFDRYIGPDDVLLLGHHQQDQLETILQRLFTGRGLLPMRAHGRVGAGRFARPLLKQAQDDLYAYLQAQGEQWIDDESNQDLGFDRNFLRAEVLPAIVVRWRRIHGAVARVAEEQANTDAALRHTLGQLDDIVSMQQLPAESGARRAWLRAYLQVRGVHDVSDRALADFSQRIDTDDGAALDCSGGRLAREGQQLHWVARSVERDDGGTLALGDTLPFGDGVLRLEVCAASDDLAMAECGPFDLRPRRGGEELRCGAAGRRRSVKRLLADAGVPRFRRAGYPLLFHQGELVCVPDVAVADSWRGVDGECCRAVYLTHRHDQLNDHCKFLRSSIELAGAFCYRAIPS